MLSYGTKTLKLSSEFMLLALVAAAVISPFTEVISGHLSDLIGRKRMYMIGACAIGLFAFPYFWLLDTRIPGLVIAAVILSLIAHDMTHGPSRHWLPRRSRAACAIAARRSAITWLRSSAGVRHPSSRHGCSPPFTAPPRLR